MPNLLDKGVLRAGREKGLHKIVEQEWTCLDEIPFDFQRRMLSVMLRPTEKAQAMLISKVRLPYCMFISHIWPLVYDCGCPYFCRTEFQQESLTQKKPLHVYHAVSGRPGGNFISLHQCPGEGQCCAARQ